MMYKTSPLPRRHEYKMKKCYVKFTHVIAVVSLAVSLITLFSVSTYDSDFLASDTVRTESISSIQTNPSCQFLPEDDAPLPIILMSLGRSGSSVTWDTMSRLTGGANIAYEITGGNRTKSSNFFNNINPSVGSDWAIERLCRIQKSMMLKDTTFGIVGFQWKPYVKTFDHKYSIGALERIAKHRNPHIRVIVLTRNPIDRLISNQRHQGHVNTDEVPHHCKIGDEKCIQKHKLHSKNIVLTTGHELLSRIGGALAHDEYIREKLSNIGVKHLQVSYEALFHKDTADEWMKIFNFLKRGPAQNLTMEMVREKFSMASTTSRKHKDTISNYDEVKHTFQGTKFYYLLHSG